MRSFHARVLLITGIAVSACSGPSEERDTAGMAARPPAGAAAQSGPAQDSMSMHAGHEETSMQAAARSTGDSMHADHVGGRAIVPTSGDTTHAGHAVYAVTRDTSHDAHAATRDTSHATHAATRDTSHAAHAVTSDTSHAAHALRSAGADTSHVAHAPGAVTRDTSHAAHADTVAAGEDRAAAHADHATVPAADLPVQAQMPDMSHRMWMQPLGGGWTLMGMAQAFPIVSTSLDADDGSTLDATELYLTQPAVMFNIESPGSRVVLRTTLNFEGVTQPDGELTFGGWGEGFLDKRHPHTLLHELMLSVNLWDVGGGALSVSAGKGFAPYGTDDPMSRPAVKYPTNHHLSQILERWTVTGAYSNSGWSLEAAVFGGGEPEGPYDLSNIESFGDSWSARLARRFGGGHGPMAATELSASFGRVREVHHEEAVVTKLYNAALRHERMYSFGTLYGLIEGSTSEPEEDEGYFSVLGETKLSLGAHRPYYRIEYATRPEYPREGTPGSEAFFRYDHDSHPIGATRWLINTIGYGYQLTGYPVSARPFVELQHNRVSAERGGIEPRDLFGRRSFWGLSAGFRVFLGGDPMRMGTYGVLDAMTAMHRGEPMGTPAAADAHPDHH